MALDARESLIACLLEMAEKETNPVLEIIDINKQLIENKKYPSSLLQFNQTGWRAYYHCHPASRAGNHRFEGEHGHFHIFVRTQTDPESWSHLVALAIDHMGQTLGWFTVNHWVTGESWESATVLIEHMKTIPFNNQNNVVERWILSLLALSYVSVTTVLNERDKMIKKSIPAGNKVDIKMDKSLYLLSEQAINLKKLLHIEENSE